MNFSITNDLLVSLLQKNFQMKQRVRLDFDQQTIQDLKSIHASLCYFVSAVDAFAEDMQAFLDDKKQVAIDRICALEDQIDNEQQSVNELLDMVDDKNRTIDELERRVAELQRIVEDQADYIYQGEGK